MSYTVSAATEAAVSASIHEPLKGCGILIIRPAGLGEGLAEKIRAAGGEAAGNDAPQDYFIGSRNEQGTHVSLKSEVQRLIGAMPAQGR